MSTFRVVFSALLLILVLASCGGDSKEKIIADVKSQMEEMAVLYEGIKDEASAKAALSKIDKFIAEGKALDKRREVLNIPKKDIDAAIKADKEIMLITKRYMDALQVIMDKPEVFKILDEKMKSGK